MSIKRKLSFSWIKKIFFFTKIFHPFRSRYPINSLELTCHPFFIVGSGRSGNTLLRRMLVSGGEVSIPPESYILARAVRKFLWFNYLSWHSLSQLIVSEFETHPEFRFWELDLSEAKVKAAGLIGKQRTFANIIELVYLSYSQQHDGNIKRWGDKTPTNALFLDHICSVFTKSIYIHVIRDPRAVYSSFKQSKLLPSSTKLDKQRIIDNWLDSHTKIESCKLDFKNCKFIVVHYETLVKNPKLVLEMLCKKLNIQFNKSMLDFWEGEAGGDIENLKHHGATKMPISSLNIDKWKRYLSEMDLLMIEENCLPLYRSLLAKYPE